MKRRTADARSRHAGGPSSVDPAIGVPQSSRWSAPWEDGPAHRLWRIRVIASGGRPIRPRQNIRAGAVSCTQAHRALRPRCATTSREAVGQRRPRFKGRTPGQLILDLLLTADLNADTSMPQSEMSEHSSSPPPQSSGSLRRSNIRRIQPRRRRLAACAAGGGVGILVVFPRMRAIMAAPLVVEQLVSNGSSGCNDPP